MKTRYLLLTKLILALIILAYILYLTRQLQQQITGKQTKPNAHKHHFARNHESLRVKLEKPVQRKGQQKPIQYRKMTPALAAGLTTRRWSVMQLISYPLPWWVNE